MKQPVFLILLLTVTLSVRTVSDQQEEKMTEDETVEWHRRFNRHKFEQTPGDSEGQGSPACCSPRGHEESDVTECLKNKGLSLVHKTETHLINGLKGEKGVY